ncbi:hypothetical protein ACVWZV_000765 [Bradyrhizobium sp. GM5.1]
MQKGVSTRPTHEFWSMHERVIALLKTGRPTHRELRLRDDISAEGLFLNPDAVLGYKNVNMSPRRLAPLLLVMTLLAAGDALAQDKGSVNPKPLPPLANPNDPTIGAKELFARKLLPSKGPAHVIGSYVKGCIGGAEQMPLNGDNWQVMRLSRNRSYGHPAMIALIKRLAARAHKDAGWPGILVGDIAQSRAAGRRCPAMPATRSASMPTSG